jgi:DNA-binding transcriptional MocR family regulator
MGHNPTGIVYSLKRRQEIYAVCSKYDVIIIEDDPYYYLQFPSSAAKEAASRDRPAPPADEESRYRPEGWKSSGYAFLDSLAPSYLNVDTDGRVIRLDTFSKTIAPGCRLGWITAQPKLIERFLRISETSTQQPSGFVQSMVAELVLGPQNADALATYRSLRTNKERIAFKGWKMDGWVRWIEGLRGEYERRMNRMCRILDQGRYQLKQGTPVNAADADWGVVTKTQLFDYSWPRGGMFVWVRFNMETHPLWGAVDSHGNLVDGTMLCGALLIFLTRKPYLVLVSPGLMFSATEEVRQHAGWRYYRMCFAAIANEDLDSCSQRFVDGVQKYWKMKSVNDLEDLLEELPTASNFDEDDRIGDFGTFHGC